jgi:hypothetical protein
MFDMPTWVQAAAAIVQAAAAIVIVVLTRRLTKANDALVRATDSYARSARDQVDELVTARLATIRPYVHLAAAGTKESACDPFLIGLIIEADIANVGSGPALDVLAAIRHDQMNFIAEDGPQAVTKDTPCVLRFRAQSSSNAGGGAALARELELLVEYRDLAGQWWSTTTAATLGYVREANSTYSQPTVAFHTQDEVVAKIDHPSLKRSVSAANRDVHSWGVV